MIHLYVAGEPKPQGSKNAYVRGGRAVLVEANKALPEWRRRVELALAEYKPEQPISGPVSVELTFFFTRPKSVKREFMTVKPDIDKTSRAILDCLVRAGILKDDSLVVDLAATKHYSEGLAGCWIDIREITD